MRQVRRSERSLRAEARFRARLTDLGAILLEPSWLGVNNPHHVRCAAGHDCWPRPGNVDRWGVCRVCVGHDPGAAATRFRARLADLGAVLLEPAWLGALSPHHVRCVAGHDCWPRPADVMSRGGGGVCRACTGLTPEAAAARFAARLIELGATLLEPAWKGSQAKHHVRCAAGHDCYPRPNDVTQGHGVCRVCARCDPATARARFTGMLAERGATLLDTEWRGVDAPHHVRCPAGHDSYPRPSDVFQGVGVCRACAGFGWDLFYVVVSDAQARVKFGVTSNGGKLRLANHARDGYTRIALLVANPDAHEVEKAVKAALQLAGAKPVRGTEYFGICTLGLILDVAANYPAALSLPSGQDTRPSTLGTHGGLP